MNKPELPPHYTVTDLRKAEGARALDYADGGRPFQVHRAGELIDEIVQLEGGSYFAEHSDAVYACWSHWTKHADPAWVAYLASLSGEDELTREPFNGFDEARPEQLEAAQTVIDELKSAFANAKLKEPTADDVILSANMQLLAEQAIRDNAGKASKLVRGIFDAKTVRGQCMSVMLAQLLGRLYSAPYGSLNEAGLDFVNILVPVLEVAVATSAPKLKHGGKARGKAK